MEFQATGEEHHLRACIELVRRCIPIVGRLQRFRDQGDEMSKVADMLRFLKMNDEAAIWNKRARDVGAAHGFFTLESRACRGLGSAAMQDGRTDEGLALLRNALVAAELNELDDPQFELDALNELIGALFWMDDIEGVTPLVLRFRKAAKAEMEKEGVCFEEFNSLLWSARLHEVMQITFSLHCCESEFSTTK